MVLRLAAEEVLVHEREAEQVGIRQQPEHDCGDREQRRYACYVWKEAAAEELHRLGGQCGAFGKVLDEEGVGHV